MPSAETLAHAARFLGSTEDSTDLMQDVEDFLHGEIDYDAKDHAERVEALTGPVADVVSKALQEVSALLALKAQRQMEERAMQEKRVQAALKQILGMDAQVGSFNVQKMTDALFGVNGVLGL